MKKPKLLYTCAKDGVVMLHENGLPKTDKCMSWLVVVFVTISVTLGCLLFVSGHRVGYHSKRSALKGRERAIFNQTNIGTTSKAMLGKLPRDGVERI